MNKKWCYEKEKTNEISFPLGGIGAGCIGLAGNGRLIDWEIFNRPNKGSLNGMTHFAVKASKGGKLIDARILNGDLHPPYIGEFGSSKNFRGFGFGPRRENLSGMPHFSEHTFIGKYPSARIEFSKETTWPGEVALNAWSPFIPGDDVNSSIPGAFFEIELHNTTSDLIDYTVVGALSNPFLKKDALNIVSHSDGLYQLSMTNETIYKDDVRYGDITLSTDSKDVSFQSYWYRGGWCDDLETYWQEFTQEERFIDRIYKGGEQNCWTNMDTGILASHVEIAPNEKKVVRFIITWNIPNCTNYWSSDDSQNAPNQSKRRASLKLENSWKNYYATKWEDSISSGKYAFLNYDYLKDKTKLFEDALFNSTLPDVVVEAVSANLSTLKSPTCLRLEDGTFYGFEGSGISVGSCEGSCSHVWNYAQALPFLFPNLERSMRKANYKYNVDENGGCHFRLMLPLGLKAKVEDFRPCADGVFGDIMKTYRDFKISGDIDWLRELWPTIKRTMEYTWSKKNYDLWDIEKKGVLVGRQHHTLDMELFGVNVWLTGYYLGALKATAEMAELFGDDEFFEECVSLFENGKEYIDNNLFNGEFYYQDLNLNDKNVLDVYDLTNRDSASSIYWNDEKKQIKYQIGEGCFVNTVIAQWMADLYGLGDVLDKEKVKSTLESIYKYNYKSTMRDMANPWRIYALNDEPGLQICTWPDKSKRPKIPLPYAQEDQGGYTYAAAIHMIGNGLIEEGLRIIEAVRGRYDGVKRNPFNEIECGSNYARAMATYSLILVFSGFEYDMNINMIGFLPLTDDVKNVFWSIGSAWGEFIVENDIIFNVLFGTLDLRIFKTKEAKRVCRVKIDGKEVSFRLSDDNKSIVFYEKVRIQQSLRLIFSKS